MTDAVSSASSGGAPAQVIWALGLTQIIGYGTLYYSFSALAPDMARDFGWPEQWVYGALSASLLAGGLIAPISGSLADRFGAAKVMGWGSIGAAFALALCAMAPERITFVTGLVAIEVASAFVLYATAFAALAQVASRHAQRSITHLTLIAGFASTIFWPLTSALHEHQSWRDIYLVFAGLNLAICLPIHVWLAKRSGPRRSTSSSETTREAARLLPDAARGRALVLMLSGFALLGFVSSAILIHMIPMLGVLGLGASGVLVTTLFGPAQVLSRLVNMRFGRGLSQPALAILASGLLPAALIVLVTTAPWPPGAAAFAILFGLGSGLSSIVSGTLPLALFGLVGYGRRLGWISSARLLVSSLAPFIFAVLAAWTSVQMALGAVIATGILCTSAFAAVWTLSDAPPRAGVAGMELKPPSAADRQSMLSIAARCLSISRKTR